MPLATRTSKNRARRMATCFSSTIPMVTIYHSVFHAFQYVEKLHLPVKYIVKTDSDCVINYDLLHRRIASYSEARRNELYLGKCRKRNTYNYKNKNKKNYVPKALLRDKTFIPYFADGGGYVISYNLLPRVLLAIQRLPFIAHNEDMNVGKAMIMLDIPCMDGPNWLARQGCRSREDCLQYVVMHPNNTIEEGTRFYSYLRWCVCLSYVKETVHCFRICHQFSL